MKKSESKSISNTTLALALLLVTSSISLPVYSVTKEASKIPAVVVSAARTEQSTLTTPASISVITRQQIEDSGAQTHCRCVAWTRWCAGV